MFFNSLDFAVFLPIVFVLYWFVFHRNLKQQNLLIVTASYIFYAWWDWRFIALIIVSTTVDYIIGILLSKEDNQIRRKILLSISILINLGILGFFKYYNFFLTNFINAFSFFGFNLKANSLYIILPVGISFYTFQTLSYTIDVYRKKIIPTKDFISFAAFVSFFPQLVAGPIERAANLLPQFYNKRSFQYSKAVDGMRQILWGLFKKIVIADNCARYADIIFNHPEKYPGAILFLGALFFTFQIYTDFSGYSDIAIGTARLFGFKLMQNFAFPYFSRDFAEFWRRWHISLSTWFRDYLYIPLGGSKGKVLIKIRNTFIIFLVSGLWHGANWTFIIWGALNALYFIPLLLTKRNRKNITIVAADKKFPSLKEFSAILFTFLLTVFTWIFFRAISIRHAVIYITNLFKNPSSFFSLEIYWNYRSILLLLLIFILIEWSGRKEKHPFAKLEHKYKTSIRHIIYYTIILAIFWFGGNEQPFIYFQF